MFDDSLKVTLFGVAAAAFLLSQVAERGAPLADVETAVPLTGLPPVPLSATPGGAPAQTRVAEVTVPLAPGFEARLLYGYALEGRVVTRREHLRDATSAVSPLDLGIVWGDLAEPGRADAISFRTVPRGVNYRAGPDAVLPVNWEEQITNNHLIPANPSIGAALMAVEVGQRVRLRGYLVVVTGDDIRPWRSSVRRNDNTIIGGCEIILVTGVQVLGAKGEAA